MHVQRAQSLLLHDHRFKFGAEKKKVVYLVRHGEGEHNVRERYGPNPSLTEKGTEDAECARDILEEAIGQDDVLFHVSPLKRTLQTFDIISDVFNESMSIRWVITPGIVERYDNDPQCNTRTPTFHELVQMLGSLGWNFKDELAPSLQKALTLRRRLENSLKKSKEEETHTQAGARLEHVLKALSSNKTHVIVTHGGVIKGYLLQLQKEERAIVMTGEVIKLTFDDSNSTSIPSSIELCSVNGNVYDKRLIKKLKLDRRWNI